MKKNNDLSNYFPKETPYEILDNLLMMSILAIIMNTLNVMVVNLNIVIAIDLIVLLLSIFLKIFHRKIIYFYYFYKGIIYSLVALGFSWLSLILLIELDDLKNIVLSIPFVYKATIGILIVIIYLIFAILNVFLGKKIYSILYEIVVKNKFNLYLIIPLLITFLIEFFIIKYNISNNLYFVYLISFSIMFLSMVFVLYSNYYIYTFVYFKKEKYIFNTNFYDYCEWFNDRDIKRKEKKEKDDVSYKKSLFIWGIFFFIIAVSTLFSYVNIQFFNFIRSKIFENNIILFIETDFIEKIIYITNYIIGLVILFRVIDGEKLKIGKINLKYKFIYPILIVLFLAVNIVSFLYYNKITDENIFYRKNVFQNIKYDIDEIKTIKVGYHYDKNKIKIKYLITFKNGDKLDIANSNNYIYKAEIIEESFNENDFEIERVVINNSEYSNLLNTYKEYIDSELYITNALDKIFIYEEN
jgi:hypothetical protein